MAEVRHQVGIVGNINKVYHSILCPEGLTGWWATTVDGTSELGNVLDLHFADVVTLSFRVDALEENSYIRLHCVAGPAPWQGSSLTFSCKQDKEQVWVGLVHTNETAAEDDFLYFSTKWTCYLLSLRDLIEHGRGRPYPHDIKIHLGD